jgi:hypothetical protein
MQLNMSEDTDYFFNLNLDPLRGDPRLLGLGDDLAALPPIVSQASFNEVCRKMRSIWARRFPDGIGSTSPKFNKLNMQITAGAVDDQIIPTSWGGVVVTRKEHPHVEKYLVIRQGGYLALEKHAEKDERIAVKEGAGILLRRDRPAGSLTVHVLEPGAGFHFKPGIEHCIIGTEDLLVFESSTDPLGMDQDLIFLYTPDG